MIWNTVPLRALRNSIPNLGIHKRCANISAWNTRLNLWLDANSLTNSNKDEYNFHFEVCVLFCILKAGPVYMCSSKSTLCWRACVDYQNERQDFMAIISDHLPSGYPPASMAFNDSSSKAESSQTRARTRDLIIVKPSPSQLGRPTCAGCIYWTYLH